LCSTQVMYARSITSRVGFACGRSATSGSARRSVSLSGSAARSIVVALLSTTARSRAFSSSRTLPGQSYTRSASLASSASALGCASRSLAIRLRHSKEALLVYDWPGNVREERLFGVFRQRLGLLVALLGDTAQELLPQDLDVVAPVPQRAAQGAGGRRQR